MSTTREGSAAAPGTRPGATDAQALILADVRDLAVNLPNGTAILSGTWLALHAGEVVTLLGPSGAGKSTLLSAVFSPEELTAKGFGVRWTHRMVQERPAFVPQRGALLDHLDVAGNIELAQAGGGQRPDALRWLGAVELDADFAARGRPVAALSGGQAQRVAVARVLAAARKIIVLDEPSVGLDPVGVRMLARLLVTQAREHRVAIVIITHDLALAGGASDRILFLHPGRRCLVPVLPEWRGPCEFEDGNQRQQRVAQLEDAVEALLLEERPRHGAAANKPRRAWDFLAVPRTAGEALIRFWEPRLAGESMVVFGRALVQALLRPLAFYAVVGALLGFTVPFIMSHISKSLEPAAVLVMIGGAHVLSLAPPLSAIIFAATSGSAINAWLGGLRLHGQVVALEGFGVAAARYLWAPAWVALLLSYAVTVIIFMLAMIFGGWILFEWHHVDHAFNVLTADFLDPKPERVPYVWRGAFLAIAYSLGVSSIVVSHAKAPKERSDDVTSAMTSAVKHSTLYVVILELATIAIVFAATSSK